MSTSLNVFNWLAPYYDFLKGIVFGRAIYNSQVYFLSTLPQGCRLLILGGGSGEILPFLGKENPSCNIWYVEASSEMLSMAAKRISGEQSERVSFIHGTENTIPEGMVFDVIITNFFLDLYPDGQLPDVCKKIYFNLHRKGRWFVTDFVDGGKWWHRVMLGIMYRVFSMTCRIEARRLPMWEAQVRAVGMEEKESKSFYGGLIKSAIYEKNPFFNP